MDRDDLVSSTMPGRGKDNASQNEGEAVRAASPCDWQGVVMHIESNIGPDRPVSDAELDAIELLLGAELKTFTK